MKNITHKYIKKATQLLFGACIVGAVLSCENDFLEEKPLDFLNSDVVLTNPEGFESAITGLYESVRHLYFREDGSKMQAMYYGTDVATTGDRSLADFKDYGTWLTPTLYAVDHYWNWGYRNLMPRANTIIQYATEQDFWESDAQRNAVIAEARFFRAYAYNFMANLYGDVPIVDQLYRAPKADFQRSPRAEVYDFARQDLEFAAQWLPDEASVDGRVTKAAAYHLLSEVYISLGDFDAAIEAATRVIDDGNYDLMRERFGSWVDQPGDVISDLHAQDNQNRSTGNMETIWNLQFEPRSTPGGTVENSRWKGVTWLRAWGPKWWEITDPNGEPGMELSVDSLGRGVAWVRPTNYYSYDIWEDEDDVRNSSFNIRRTYYYNNPASEYFGQEVQLDPNRLDSMVQFYPMLTKIEGTAEYLEGANYGRSFKDVYLMRLAETYLLRAEAYLLNGNPDLAAADINEVRQRANASPITGAEVDLDFILDERARELIIEENRRLTLNRMGKLVERTKMYNPQSGPSIQEHHELFPIPQTTIDANIDAPLKQNPGYL
ncbi:RagB/SusD family nutrient uptake outer membrane protein [Echinicola vietnamensis]|uniref:RagB/SusD family protein n=1 Tax=Echinicola vietnamensis (strain DSM 17526 / LMG 23754 / KMM 6221) TaxID=926556 RepID=L0FY11_ECHVK|nr:RagB/SusD family nutrient uptake outer membrane protein [Echinicola vietnamensis]AGA77938.1 RagB/SusD family protein [Echinicola vietnamensis DSM 17526]